LPAGENIGSGDGFLSFTGRWTDRKKHLIMESRCVARHAVNPLRCSRGAVLRMHLCRDHLRMS
jgi:hypothetical protein